MVCEDCRVSDASLARLSEELRRKDAALEAMEAKSKKAKLQAKGKIAALRADVEALADGDADSAALLLRLEAAESELASVREELLESRQKSSQLQTLDNDHRIRIRSLEDELAKTSASLAEVSQISQMQGSHSIAPFIQDEAAATAEDVKALHAQALHKDTRILELNNDLLAKDRQILDLQELCRERSDVLTAKNSALQILHLQLKEAQRPPMKDSSVQTSQAPMPLRPALRMPLEVEAAGEDEEDEAEPPPRMEQSPGRAVPILFSHNNARGSPPPTDPADDGRSSLTTESAPELGDLDARELSPGRSSIRHLSSHLEGMLERVSSIQKSLGEEEVGVAGRKSKAKKGKKRVTWDLREAEGASSSAKDATELAELRSENEELRSSLSEIETFTRRASSQRRRPQWRTRREGGDHPPVGGRVGLAQGGEGL